MEVNGTEAVILPVTVTTPEGPVALSIAAYRGNGDAAYHFLTVSAPSSRPGPLLEQLFRSFRLISPQEAGSLRPRRIDVVRAGPTDTAAALAARMASEHKLEHFLMLNGRAADQPVRPGEMVKIVSYSAPVGAVSGGW
jgi:predicted Zn-dependent protease